ncbi:MAG: YkgJ family cysteine cluster protein [Candidatus Lokiarchaeota archaeon]|nr:YkgJ family cysteine cluster protein [Candidatus Lokiarchaeota archaeon]
MKNKCENCGKCCLETEMILSSEDIELINKNLNDNIGEGDFVFKNNNKHFQLKNIEGHCKFLDLFSKKCKIYEFRPQGCRFYPLIYDINKKKCIPDEDCPRTNLFYINIQDLKNACQNLKIFLEKQLNMKIN